MFPQLIFFIWFVNPFFCGYERVYSFAIDGFLLPNKDRVQRVLEYMHEKQYRYLTYTVQYLMKVFDSGVKQINEFVMTHISQLIYRLKRNLLASI